MNISQTHAKFATSRRSLRKPFFRPPPTATGFGPFDHESLERQFLLIKECHTEQLSAAAALALREGRYRDAYMYADRRCRIKPFAGASEYLLRASALSRLGEHALAQADLKAALDIDPNHPLANLTALRTAAGKDRLKYAAAIVQNESVSSSTTEAIKAIAALGYLAIGVFTATPSGVIGWFVWKGGTRLQVQASSDAGVQSLTIAANPAHPLGRLLGNAVDISIPWPRSSTYLAINPSENRALILNGTLLRPSLDPSQRPLRHPGHAPIATQPAPPAVIVPIYGDHEATRLCLNSLLNDRQQPAGTRFILVNDASPDPRLHALVQSFSEGPDVSFLAHNVNLGFARSVNDALATLPHEDVVILNADTMVPSGFIARLRNAAHSAPDIGTVTPFSNNGEYTSFPIPFRENPLPGLDEITMLDRLAARVNSGQIIDMPNGTAFCMYVTRNCLNAIGPLSTNFGKGYYEDVEFCLRAAKAGFRNVCAADVYVGHAGSKSFGDAKRALVTRNLAALESVYPHYRTVSATFMDADPLAPARRAIETAALENSAPVHLLVAGNSADESLIARRCAALSKGSDRVLLANARLTAGTLKISIRAPDGEMPQSIVREFSANEPPAAIFAWLEEFRVARVELLDYEATPVALARAILGGPFKTSLVVPRGRAETARLVKPSDLPDDDPDGAWSLAMSHADTLLADDEPAHRILTTQFGSAKIIQTLGRSQACKMLSAFPSLAFKQPRLGVMGADDAATLSLVSQLVGNARPRLDCEAVFLGTAFDDLRLMATGRLFCTGKIDLADLSDITRLYQISHLLITDENIPDEIYVDYRASRVSGFALARIVPAAKRIATSGDHLIIPSGASIPAMANALKRWIARRPEAAHG